jgi:hypothetical protein
VIAQLRNGHDVEFVARAATAASRPTSSRDRGVQAAIEVAIRRYREASRLTERSTSSRTALERARVIERAKGIVMERHGVGEREAFERLRDHARASSRAWSTWHGPCSTGTRCCPAAAAPGATRADARRREHRDGRARRPPRSRPRADDFKRAFERFRKDRITDHAAALTYYSLLSLFPALLLGVPCWGLRPGEPDLGRRRLPALARGAARDASTR